MRGAECTIDGTRTRTARKPGDFKSPASTDSATMARATHCTTFPSKKQAMLFHTKANATFVPIKFSPASFNPFLRVWDARHTTSRRFPTTPAHGFQIPRRFKACLKLASRALLRSRLTTPYPCGAKAALLAKLPYAVGSFHPAGQPCGLANRPSSRRPLSHPRATGALAFKS